MTSFGELDSVQSLCHCTDLFSPFPLLYCTMIFQPHTHTHTPTHTGAPYSYPYSEIFLLDGAGPAGNLFIHGGWGLQPVCAVGFGEAEAEVACRQMGYEGAVAVGYEP